MINFGYCHNINVDYVPFITSIISTNAIISFKGREDVYNVLTDLPWTLPTIDTGRQL